MKERYKESLENINQLDEAVGGDSFLDFYRGNILYAQGDLEAAEAYFMTATSENPDFLDAYDGLLTVYIDGKQNKKAVEILNYFVNHFGVTKSDLAPAIEGEPSYSVFAKSKEYKACKTN
mgnify:CR=1 FL=1